VTDFDAHDRERALLAERLAALDAEFEARPVYWTRSMLRDATTFGANRAAILEAQRAGRILADDATLPEGGRWFEPPAASTRTYTVDELRDPANFGEDVYAAAREGRITGAAKRGIQRRSQP
jgi:hypothetical protein